MKLLDLTLLVVGIALLIFSVIWGRSLNRRKVELALSKLGFDLKADTFTLLLLFAFILISQGLFFRYMDYERRVSSLQATVSDTNTRLKETLDALRSYELQAVLVFPPSEQPDPSRAEVQAWVTRRDDTAAKLHDRIRVIKGEGGIIVHFMDLRVGDSVRVVTLTQGKKWQSDDMELPRSRFRMTLQGGGQPAQPGGPL